MTASAFSQLFRNAWLWGAIGVSALLQVAVVNLGFLNLAFGTFATDHRPMAGLHRDGQRSIGVWRAAQAGGARVASMASLNPGAVEAGWPACHGRSATDFSAVHEDSGVVPLEVLQRAPVGGVNHALGDLVGAR